MTALSDARFLRLLIGNSVSSFGDSALYLSLGIWAKDLTGSNAAAGAIFLAEGLPCLASPLAGQLADRVARRPLLIAANAATGAAVLALLMVHSQADLWVMYAVAIFYGAASVIIGPAGSALLKDLLADEDLVGANAMRTTISQGLRIASPLAGAAIYASLGGGALAVLDSATFGVAIAALLSVSVTETKSRATAGEPIRTLLLAGAAHIRRTPLLAQLTLSSTIAMLVLGFYESVTFAVIAAMGRPASFFGVLMSIQAAGSIIGGLAVLSLIKHAGEARTLGIALTMWAIASLIYTIPALPAACTALAICGVAIPLNTVVVSTATQQYSPPHLQGRTFAASFMAIDIAQTLSITIGAALVDTLGYRPLLIIAALVLSITAVPVLTRPAQPLRSARAYEPGTAGGIPRPCAPGGRRAHSDAVTLIKLMFQAADSMASATSDVLAELELTQSQARILWALDPGRPPVPMRELARTLHFDPSNITLMTDRLAEAGLVERRPHPTDGRQRVLVLTDSGVKVIALLIAKLLEQSPIFSLSSQELAELARLLAKAQAGRSGLAATSPPG